MFVLFVRYDERFWNQWRRGYTLQTSSLFHRIGAFYSWAYHWKRQPANITSLPYSKQLAINYFGQYNSVAFLRFREFPRAKIRAWAPCAQKPLFVGAFSHLHCSPPFINNSSLGSNDLNRLHTRIQSQALRPCYKMYSGQTLATCQTLWV